MHFVRRFDNDEVISLKLLHLSYTLSSPCLNCAGATAELGSREELRAVRKLFNLEKQTCHFQPFQNSLISISNLAGSFSGLWLIRPRAVCWRCHLGLDLSDRSREKLLKE